MIGAVLGSLAVHKPITRLEQTRRRFVDTATLRVIAAPSREAGRSSRTMLPLTKLLSRKVPSSKAPLLPSPLPGLATALKVSVEVEVEIYMFTCIHDAKYCRLTCWF